MMSHVDLCSGIGGFALGFEWAGLSKPVLFCDIEPWSRKILAKHWPDVPIAEDVKELANDPDRFIPRTDPGNTILTAGYPCQPFSVAGKQRGKEDPRHIYPYIAEIIARKRPAFVVLENVFGHLSLGMDAVLNDLAHKDYASRAFIFPSGAIVGAPHHRNRIFIIARNMGNPEYSGSFASEVSGKHREDDARGAQGQIASEQSEGASEPGHDANVADADSLQRLNLRGQKSKQTQETYKRSSNRSSTQRKDVGNAGCVTKGQSRGGLSEERLNSGAQGQWSVEGHRLADTSENVADTEGNGRLERQSNSRRRSKGSAPREKQRFGDDDSVVADTNGEGLQGHTNANRQRLGQSRRQQITDQSFSRRKENGDKRQFESRICHLADGLPKGLDRFDGWEREPADIPRVATGVKDRVNRLKGLGNAIVPQIAMQIGLTIKAVRDE